MIARPFTALRSTERKAASTPMVTVGQTHSMTARTKQEIQPLVERTPVQTPILMVGQILMMPLMTTPRNGQMPMVMAMVTTLQAQPQMIAPAKLEHRRWTEWVALMQMKMAIQILMDSGPPKMVLMPFPTILTSGLIMMKTALVTTGLTIHGLTET